MPVVSFSTRSRQLVLGALAGVRVLPLDNRKAATVYRWAVDHSPEGLDASVWDFLRVTQGLREGRVCPDTPLPQLVEVMETLWAIGSLRRAS